MNALNKLNLDLNVMKHQIIHTDVNKKMCLLTDERKNYVGTNINVIFFSPAARCFDNWVSY